MSKRNNKRERRNAVKFSGNKFYTWKGPHGDGQASGDNRHHAGAGADPGADASPDPFEGACQGTVPIVAWKALQALDTGLLRSPQVPDFQWPSYKRVEAKGCSASARYPGWSFVNLYGERMPTAPHDPCEPSCNCGIHLGLTLDHCWPYMEGAANALVRVHGWGRVVAHETGYRVQYAYPEEIILIGRPNNAELGYLAERVAMRYGVPVTIVSRKAMLDRAAREAVNSV